MKSLVATVAALVLLGWLLVVWMPSAVGADRFLTGQTATSVNARGEIREYGYGQIRFNGRGPEAWRWQTIKARRDRDDLQRRLTARVLEVRALRRTLNHRSSVREAIGLAATVYGNRSTLWRKARCESRLSPTAKNPRSTAAGLFQFLDTTWASTPFAGFDVYSPYANALAAGWMHRHGRSGEWVCT